MREITRNGRTYKVGIITVPSFYNDMEDADNGNTNNRSTTNDVRRLLQQLAADGGVDALVLDLRGDGGGYLPEAIGLTHLFINHGPVVQLRDTTGQLEVLDQPDPGQVYTGPLAVLVDRTSASASEIFAGADPGLSSRPDHRPDHLRQGHGAERDPARSLVLASDRGTGDRDHRQVLPRHRREHAAARCHPGYRAALPDQPEGRGRERAR